MWLSKLCCQLCRGFAVLGRGGGSVTLAHSVSSFMNRNNLFLRSWFLSPYMRIVYPNKYEIINHVNQ